MSASQCRLLKGSTALAAQLTLATTILGTLLYKRQREKPKRRFVVWLMDVSKQAICATTCHIINMTFAVLAFRNTATHEDTGNPSECSWYFLQYNLDNALGVPLTMLVHSAFVAGARAYTQRPDVKYRQQQNGQISFTEIVASCGNYGTPPKLSWWAIQVLEWIIAVIAARCLCGSLVFLLSDSVLQPVASLFDDSLGHYPVLQLYVVIVVYPMILSTTVAWILDGLLKRTSRTAVSDPELTEHMIEIQEGIEE